MNEETDTELQEPLETTLANQMPSLKLKSHPKVTFDLRQKGGRDSAKTVRDWR